MGKKKFKDGLESLFTDAREDYLSTGSPLLLETEPQKESQKNRTKSSSGKHFSDELEMFFQESLRETIQDQLSADAANRPGQSQKAARARRSSKPKDGLDALIRRTIETSEIELHYDESKKRVAFSFDKDKLEKLKQIARQERTFLKDIIARVVAEYIQEYEKKKGV